MASRSKEYVTFGHIALLVTITLAVVGGGFTWMHSDMNDIKTALRELTRHTSDLRASAAATDGKVEILVREAQRRR